MFDITTSSEIHIDEALRTQVHPRIHPSTFVCTTARIEGNVTIGPDCWIGPHAVVRGLEGPVRIEAGCSIQDHCRVESRNHQPMVCEPRVRVGHGAHLFGSYLEKGSVIGLLAICHPRSRVGAYSMLGAMTVVHADQQLSSNMLYVGNPAKGIRSHEGKGLAIQERITDEYIGFAREYPHTLVLNHHAQLVYQLDGKTPTVHPSVKLDASAVVIGDVHIDAHATLGPGVVIRGDNGPIRIESHAVLNTNAVVHASRNIPTFIGEHAYIGAHAVLHGSALQDHVVIGNGAVVLDKTVVQSHTRIAAHAFVKGGLVLPANTMWSGNPLRQE